MDFCSMTIFVVFGNFGKRFAPQMHTVMGKNVVFGALKQFGGNSGGKNLQRILKKLTKKFAFVC